MKQNYQKINKGVLAGIFALFAICLNAQDITYITLSIINAENTNDGSDDYYEADVYISSTPDTYLSSGQVYIDFNEDAFGPLVVTNGNVEYSQPPNSILGFEWAGVPFSTPAYQHFIINDNTSFRFSPSFQQNIALVGLETQPDELQITATPKALFHFKLKYADVTKSPDVCFKSDGVFQDQFFTACGGTNSADCINSPGVQIVNDVYDCSEAVLSINKNELLNLVLYPNPVKDILFVKIKTEASFTIYNINGQKQQKGILSNGENSVNMSNLSAGLYLIHIESETHKSIKKVIKSN